MSNAYPGWKIDIYKSHCVNKYPYERWLVKADNCLFDEVYEGPLFIAEKLILSHEPIDLPFAFNIHGHDHSNWHKSDHHLNVCAEYIDYTPVNVNRLFKNGFTSKVDSIHRMTIDRAVESSKILTQLISERYGCNLIPWFTEERSL